MILRVFSRAYEPLDEAKIEKVAYSFDYLALDATQIVVPKELTASPADFIVFGPYDGLITAVDKSIKGKTTLTVKPLLEILNISAYQERARLGWLELESFFAEWIGQEFVYNEDAVQNIQGLTVEALSRTYDAKLNLVDNVNNIYEIAVTALLKYRMVINMRLRPAEKKLICTVGINASPADYVRLDTKNIIEKKVVLQDSIGACNKLTAVDGNGLERNMVYYADGYDVPTVPVTELIKAGTKEAFKTGTKYGWVYMPYRPKPPQVYIDAKFVDAGCWIIINSIPIAQWDVPGIIVITPTLYFFYPFEEYTAFGYTFTANTWHQLDDGVYSACPDGYPATGLDDDGKPGIFIDGEVQISTRLEMLGDYVSTRPIEFYERAVERTYDLFKPAGTNNLIEITVPDTDTLLPEIEIGREDLIINEGNEIPSVLTGWRAENGKITRIYGGVRLELTKKLKFEKR